MVDRIQIEKLGTYQREDIHLKPVGSRMMETPRGDVRVDDVPGFLTLLIYQDGDPYSVAVLVYEPLPGRGEGMIVQMDANTARTVAGSLILLAECIESAGGAQ